MEKLQGYAEQGFLRCRVKPDGSVDYEEDDFKKIGQIQSLTAIVLTACQNTCIIKKNDTMSECIDGVIKKNQKFSINIVDEAFCRRQITAVPSAGQNQINPPCLSFRHMNT